MKVFREIQDFDFKNAVVTTGIFDGVHRGHNYILQLLVQKAKEIDGESVVITFFPHPRMVFNTEANLKFLTTIEEKITLIEDAGIDYLIIIPFTKEFAAQTACEFVAKVLVGKIRTKYLMVGFNHKFGRRGEGDYKFVKKCAVQYGFEVERIEPFHLGDVKISSTLIRKAFENNEIQKANYFLGYSYNLSGTVIGGSRIGRSIGFPTANIKIDDSHKLIPPDGVYAVRLKLFERMHYGMLNIGFRPTIADNLNKTIEVHILNFSRDIYSSMITIYFEKKIRDEMKFNGIDELKYQLTKDKQTVYNWFRNEKVV